MKQIIAFLLLTISFLINTAISNAQPSPKLISFAPASYSNKFSLNVTPVLKINPGDTVRTETIDALGIDKSGVHRAHGGNPLDGPFYIEGAQAGDVLAVTLNKVALNRPYAYTTEAFVSRSMPDSIAKQFKKFNLVKWKLDIENGLASPDSTPRVYEHLKNFTIPVKPFLGCIGVAPSNKKNEILSFFEGEFGGNMDFSETGQSAIVYLPVFHDGAYFYIGDGHALEGDGEIAGNALETSLDVEFTVRLIKNKPINFPRVDNKGYIMAIGAGKSLDNAIKIAGMNLLDWLRTEYSLSTQEATQVLSTSIEYQIGEIADPNVLVVAKLKKEIVKQLIR